MISAVILDDFDVISRDFDMINHAKIMISNDSTIEPQQLTKIKITSHRRRPKITISSQKISGTGRLSSCRMPPLREARALK
jgi:hypothetical protein